MRRGRSCFFVDRQAPADKLKSMKKLCITAITAVFIIFSLVHSVSGQSPDKKQGKKQGKVLQNNLKSLKMKIDLRIQKKKNNSRKILFKAQTQTHQIVKKTTFFILHYPMRVLLI